MEYHRKKLGMRIREEMKMCKKYHPLPTVSGIVKSLYLQSLEIIINKDLKLWSSKKDHSTLMWLTLNKISKTEDIKKKVRYLYESYIYSDNVSLEKSTSLDMGIEYLLSVIQ